MEATLSILPIGAGVGAAIGAPIGAINGMTSTDTDYTAKWLEEVEFKTTAQKGNFGGVELKTPHKVAISLDENANTIYHVKTDSSVISYYEQKDNDGYINSFTTKDGVDHIKTANLENVAIVQKEISSELDVADRNSKIDVLFARDNCTFNGLGTQTNCSIVGEDFKSTLYNGKIISLVTGDNSELKYANSSIGSISTDDHAKIIFSNCTANNQGDTVNNMAFGSISTYNSNITIGDQGIGSKQTKLTEAPHIHQQVVGSPKK